MLISAVRLQASLRATTQSAVERRARACCRTSSAGRRGAWAYEGTYRYCVQERALNIPRGRFLVKGLIQSISDLSDASIGTGFVLVAARRAPDANSSDRFVAGLDRHAAEDSDELSIVKRGIERARRSLQDFSGGFFIGPGQSLRDPLQNKRKGLSPMGFRA